MAKDEEVEWRRIEEVVYGQYLGLYNIKDHPEGNITKKCPLYSGLYAA